MSMSTAIISPYLSETQNSNIYFLLDISPGYLTGESNTAYPEHDWICYPPSMLSMLKLSMLYFSSELNSSLILSMLVNNTIIHQPLRLEAWDSSLTNAKDD